MALTFDGVDDYVDHGAGASFDVSSDLTFAAWFNPTIADGTGRRLFNKRKTGGTEYWDVVIADYDGARTLELGRGRATAEQYSGAGNAFPALSEWYLGIFVFTAGTYPRTYIGRLSTSTPPAEVTYGYSDAGSGSVGIPSGTALWVGRRPSIASYAGAIARVGIWNHAFDSTEIADLWTQTAAEWAAIADCLLACAYSGTGTQSDLSGNGNDGTVNGATDSADPTFPSAGGGKPTLYYANQYSR